MATLRFIKRIGFVVAGAIILLIGLAMTVLPGPAIVFIPLGLGLLGSEFLIIRRLTRKARDRIKPRQWRFKWPRKFMRTVRYWLGRALRFMNRRARSNR
jgi:hypothetical protein